MSSQYPVLNNRPIDQWKVTELKEELKRRKLITKGLKDDLIRRLDDALRVEGDNAEEETTVEESDTTNEEFGQEIRIEPENVKTKLSETHLVEDSLDNENKAQKVDETATNVEIDGERDGKAKLVGPKQVEDGKHGDKDETRKVDDSAISLDNDDKLEYQDKKPVANQMVDDVIKEKTHKVDETATDDITDISVNSDEKVQDGKFSAGNDSAQMGEEPVVPAVSVETSVTVAQTVVTQITSSGEKFSRSENQAKNEAPNHPHIDDVLNVFDSNNQVSEVSSVLGLKVNESVSSDSLSINETNELKDSLNVNNFHELEVKPKIVEPSSSDLHPEGGDVPELAEHMQVDNQRSVEEIDDTNATILDMSKQMDTVDAGSSEQLNLDPSAGDNIMEEDVLKSKQMDWNNNSDDVNIRNDTQYHILKEESGIDTSAHLSSDKDISAENGNNHAGPAEKRKFQGQVVVENSEPPKRQRKFNYGTPKVVEPPNSTLTPTTPKDTFQSTIPKRNFSRSDSTVSSGEETPKERVVPPSSRPPTNSLRIDRFLRPFTLKAVKELLGKTGTVSSFWMDQIKTHCYVTYSSVGEAEETRKAVYNLQWPSNGGHLLVAEFVDPQEVKVRVEPPVQPAAPPANRSQTTPVASTPVLPKPLPRQHILKEHLPLPPSPPVNPPLARERAQLPTPPVLLSNPPPSRETVQLPPPPPLPTKEDIPVLTLDDLFKKTKSTPRIYYLPLSDDQVAAKIAAGNRNSK